MPLEWTGERFIPGLSGSPLYYEHAHRYAYAARFSSGRVVLDVGSGEAYGPALLAPVARTVIGLDTDPEVIARARKTYGPLPNLRFGVSDAQNLPIHSASIDLVTCFDVIERVQHPARLIDEARRVLRPDGVFIVSTPDKGAYRASRHDEPNQFHVSEMHLHELRAALAQHFASVEIMGQRLIGSSVMWPLAADTAGWPVEVVTTSSVGGPMSIPLRDAVPVLYAVAVCTNDQASSRPVAPSLFIDCDAPLFDETYQQMEDAENGLAAATAQLERMEDEVRGLRAALEGTMHEVESQRHASDTYRHEAERLRVDLEAERSSTGGALLARYRRAIERIAPSGSTRRRGYLLIPRTLRAAYRRFRRGETVAGE